MKKTDDVGKRARAAVRLDTTQPPPEIDIIPPPNGPKAYQLKKYEHVIKRLDGCIDDVMDKLISLIDHEDPNVSLRVCEMLLKRYLPERKIKEVVGADGGPVQINQNTDMRTVVLNVVEALDSVDYDTLKGRIINGQNLAIHTSKSDRERET